MSDQSRHTAGLPPEQEAIRAKCFHPSGTFVEFKPEEVEQSIPERFEKIVRKYPDRIAIKTDSRAVTYVELNGIANRIARAILAEQGNEAEPVGLLFEKGAPLIAAMIGVLKTGKFFVLLDPSFPKTRISAVLEDSQARVVITNSQCVAFMKDVAFSAFQLMEFERIDSSISTENPELPISPRALAFITYTSGSTGEPKGVVQNHRYLLHCVMTRTNEYHICEHDRLSLLTSANGNAINNAFVPLLTGAALLPYDAQKEGGIRLANWLSQEKISICPISSPLFRNFTGTLTGKEHFPHLRVIRLTSDAVHKSDADLYKQYFSADCILATGLSSSETGFARTYLLDDKTEISGSEVPLGYAVENKDIFLLDDSGNEVGSNEIGEIAVRSSYISPGYWRKPDLTRAKFIPDPNGGDESIYLTGDLGLMLSDGCLVYKGRKDFRVKVRGHGVEFAEVEKAMREHLAVKEAVVVARENELGEPRLVAYFTSPSRPTPSVTELHDFLKGKLADYMIPSAFVMLDAIPLTPQCKVDRRALPHPSSSRPNLDTPFVAPRTPVEAGLTRIWSEVLALDGLGIHDNFFYLGGHSLAATRVIIQVIKTFRLEIPLQCLFQSPTVAEMALVITKHQVRKLNTSDLERIIIKLESLTDDEVQRLLSTSETRISTEKTQY